MNTEKKWFNVDGNMNVVLIMVDPTPGSVREKKFIGVCDEIRKTLGLGVKVQTRGGENLPKYSIRVDPLKEIKCNRPDCRTER